MTTYTASLRWRVVISCAASYCMYLEELSEAKLRFMAQFHKVGDIRVWARERIVELLETASKLEPVFSHDEVLWISAQSAAEKFVERLARTGFQLTNAPDVTGAKTN